ncbi:MAG TPA: PAS domain S-box protein [Patescibacteria group bacterium]|nr:PAS domain S-box protein [Patescibacteria group bacterium]
MDDPGSLRPILGVAEPLKVEVDLELFISSIKLTAECGFGAVLILDGEGTIVYASSMLEEMTNQRPEEVVGTPFIDLVPPDSRDMAHEALSDALKGESIQEQKLSLKRKGGDAVSVEVNLKPVESSGAISWTLCFLREVDDYERQYKGLKESEERYRSLFELAPEGILTTDLKGTITSANSAFYKLTGFSEEEVVGKFILSIGTISMRDFPKLLGIFKSIIQGKKTGSIKFRYNRKDGSIRWAEGYTKVVHVGPRKWEGLAVLRDITERKENEDALQRSLEELTRSNQELDDYTYVVSHDLKAPLRSIMAFSEFLNSDYGDKLDETGMEYLSRIQAATTRMDSLIEDLLVLSRIGRLYLETAEVDLDELMQSIILDFEAQIKESGAEITWDHLPTLRVWRVWIRQLLANLIANGLKFNESKVPKVHIGFREKDEGYVFSVRDNGIGIKKANQEKIFKLFQRLHTQEEYPGTGAGLAICKKIVESLGGRIWVESKQGRRSTFYFTVPKDIGEGEMGGHAAVDAEADDVTPDIIIEYDSSLEVRADE